MRRAAAWQRLGLLPVTLLVLLFSHHAGALAAAKPGPAAAEDAVRALESARAAALLAADTTALSRLIDDDFVEISRFAQLRTKADNVREIGNGDLKLTSVKYDSLKVRIYGDVAVLMGIADNTGLYRGIPFAGKLRYTRIFVRHGGTWRAVAMQHTMLQ